MTRHDAATPVGRVNANFVRLQVDDFDVPCLLQDVDQLEKATDKFGRTHRGGDRSVLSIKCCSQLISPCHFLTASFGER